MNSRKIVRFFCIEIMRLKFVLSAEAARPSFTYSILPRIIPIAKVFISLKKLNSMGSYCKLAFCRHVAIDKIRSLITGGCRRLRFYKKMHFQSFSYDKLRNIDAN